MKSIYFLTIFLCGFLFATYAQSPNWLWAKSAGEWGINQGMGISTDANGNIYVTGFSDSTIVFGSDTLFNVGLGNIFIAKYNSGGEVIWAKRVNGTGNDEGEGISTDANGNVYVTGYFESPRLVFGNDTLINTSGSGNIFIAKYDSSGNALWGKSGIGAAGMDVSYGVSADKLGFVYITGFFGDSTIKLGSYTLTNEGTTNVFIAKYDSSGNVIWAKSSIGTGYNYGQGISTDAQGNSYVTGVFGSPIIIFGNDSLMNAGYENFFIVKYDLSGNVVWGKNAQRTDRTSSIDVGQSISADANGNVYATGYFTDTTIVFGYDTLINIGNGINFFIVKYDSAGYVLWVKTAIGNDGDDRGYGISTDAASNAYVTGAFAGTFVFATDTLSNLMTVYNAFVAKYDPSGNIIWAKKTGETQTAHGLSISTDAIGHVFVTGYFNDTITCGTDTLISPNQQTSIFVAVIDSSSYSGVGIKTINPSGKITIYPNPSTSTFYFSGVQTGSGIEVYNMLGEMIYSGQTNADIYPVSLGGQAKGMYFYKVSNNAGTIQQGKMILE